MTPARAHGSPALPTGQAPGRVVAAHRRHFVVAFDDGATLACVLRGRSTVLACGDRVVATRADGGGVIEAVLPRATLFYRSDAFKEKLLAANVDQVVGVVAPGPLTRRGARPSLERGRVGARLPLRRRREQGRPPGIRGARGAPPAAGGAGPCDRPGVGAARRRAAGAVACGTTLGAGGPVGDGQVDVAQRGDPGRRRQDGRGVAGAGERPAHDDALDALPAPGRRGCRLDRRLSRPQGVRPRAPRSRRDRRRVSRVPPCIGQCRFRDCRHDAEPECAFRDAVAAGRAAGFRLELMRALVAESNAAHGRRR